MPRPLKPVILEERIVEILRDQQMKYTEVRRIYGVSLRIIKRLVKKHQITRTKGRKQVLDSAFKSLLCRYKRQAKDRNLPFAITKGLFQILITSPCHYCGDMNSNTLRQHRYVLQYNGIDRKVNSEGYLPENCVPCCEKCNWMKGKSNCEEFLEKIQQIYLYSTGNLGYKGNGTKIPNQGNLGLY